MCVYLHLDKGVYQSYMAKLPPQSEQICCLNPGSFLGYPNYLYRAAQYRREIYCTRV